MMHVPGQRSGDSPPATPKLITPVAPSLIALDSEAARFLPLPLQMTLTPGPAAMRASNAKPTTAINRSPLPIAPAHVSSTPPPALSEEAFPVPLPHIRSQNFPSYPSRRIFEKSAIRFARCGYV